MHKQDIKKGIEKYTLNELPFKAICDAYVSVRESSLTQFFCYFYLEVRCI